MTDADVGMGRVVADRYVIGRVLGSGTMGTVRAARDLELDQDVAIKFVNVDGVSREDAVERFRREVQVAERIKSEHVVRVLGTGSLSDGTPFMVMELLRGRGLDEERDLRGVIPVDEAVGYVLQAIEVLAEVHAAGVVHRDMKPANLFLEARPPAPHFVKVLDFGVSKSAVDLASLEKDGMIMGSPLYMAPEQLRASNSADSRADIWSLGAILFELVTGYTAHQGDSVAAVCETLLRDPPRPITDFASGLPPGFSEVVMRCLDPDRERRYSNVAELGAALLPFAPSGAVHVERARRLLGRSALESIGERPPSSDAPVTLHVGGATNEAGNHEVPGQGTRRFPREEQSDLGGFRMLRVALAFTFLGLGVGTAFLIETRYGRPSPVAAPALATVAFVPAVVDTASAASQPLAPSAPIVTPSVAGSASASGPVSNAPVAEPRRPHFEPRRWKPNSRRKAGVAQPRAATSGDVSDFGGRR